MSTSNQKYSELIDSIGSTLQKVRENAIKAVNNELVKANLKIGQYIVEYEQQGKEKADYGRSLRSNLAKDFKLKYGKGSKSSIYLCRQFYIKYPIFQTVSGKLSWSHFAELLTVSTTWQEVFMSSNPLKKKGCESNETPD